MLIAILAMWAVGLYQIWSIRPGLLGSIGSILFSFTGGAIGLVVGSQIMETMLSIVALHSFNRLGDPDDIGLVVRDTDRGLDERSPG